ncbi:helix-turn-helix domain-containing protein [bacterium]|nr:helix-turn-helix domain-containing protein [bacterium]
MVIFVDILSTFSERLKELCVDQGITSNEVLSKKLGISAETVRLWKNGQRYISLSQLVNLAECLNCSIDYLAGRNEKVLDFTPQSCPPFYNRLRTVMTEKHVTRYKLVKNTKIYDSYFSNWKNGADVHILTLVLLADYLDCSIDYLIGREM